MCWLSAMGKSPGMKLKKVALTKLDPRPEFGEMATLYLDEIAAFTQEPFV